MNAAIFEVLQYFSQFDYPPTEEELWQFLSIKTSPELLHKRLLLLAKSNNVTLKDNRIYYKTVNIDTYAHRFSYSTSLLDKSRPYLKILKFISSLEYVGISGSLSMNNADAKSDIDIFIITKAQTVWRTRFFLLVYKKILSVLVPSVGTNLCFNLFFGSNSLKIQKEKQSLYISHELLQLKEIINKKQIYNQLLYENQWITNFLPNVQIKSKNIKEDNNLVKQSKSMLFFENICGKVQKWWLHRKGYRFIDERGNLWLIQEDFENKLTR